jgi:hypothetical protein
MTSLLGSVSPTDDEVRTPRDGDEIVPHPDVVMDRGFTVAAPPEAVWPWLVQLGKRRAGWYLPRSVERLVPPGRRALRRLDQRWQRLETGDLIPDYGGPHETFEVAAIEEPRVLVYRSRRRGTNVSWAITLTPSDGTGTRVHLRLRLAPVRHRRIAEVGGGLFDLLTIAGLAAGLRERVED